MITQNTIVKWDSAVGKCQGKVIDIIKEGDVSGVAIKLVGSDKDPALKIELDKPGEPIYIAKLVSEVEEVGCNDSDDIFPIPTPEQVSIANQYLPVGFPSLEANDFAVIQVRAADNLRAISNEKWTKKELLSLAEMIVGKAVMTDHDWDNVIESSHGIVISAKVITTTPSDRALNQNGNKEINTQIVKAEGYHYLLLECLIDKESCLLPKIATGQVHAVSLGAFRYKKLACPRCGMDMKVFSKAPKECPQEYGCFIGDGPESSSIPYVIRTDVVSVGELSFVFQGNQPDASILLNGDL